MTQARQTAEMTLTDIVRLAHPDALSRILGLPVRPDMLSGAAGSQRLLRRWVRQVQDATGLPSVLTHDDGPATRAVLRKPLEELDALARVVDACLARDALRCGIDAADVSALKLRFGPTGYTVGLSWDGAMPILPAGADGWDAFDAWISARPADLKGYIALRCPHPPGPRVEWAGPALDGLMDYAAAAVFAPPLEDAA